MEYNRSALSGIHQAAKKKIRDEVRESTEMGIVSIILLLEEKMGQGK